MTTEDSIRAAQVFETMTEEEATAWLAAGDYTSVSGIPLPEAVSTRIAEIASEQEVQGFAMELNPFGPVPIPYPNAGSSTKGTTSRKLYEACCKGTHIPEVTIE